MIMARSFAVAISFPPGAPVPSPEGIAKAVRFALSGPMGYPVAVDVVPGAWVAGAPECRTVNAYHKAIAAEPNTEDKEN